MGENPYPVHLVRPPVAPLSAMAQLGRADLLRCQPVGVRTACRAPPATVRRTITGRRMRAGDAGRAGLNLHGVRPAPRSPIWSASRRSASGPTRMRTRTARVPLQVALAVGARHAPKTAQQHRRSAANLVPQGGLFWDGRVNTLQEQAIQPLLNPLEMANPSVAASRQSCARARTRRCSPAVRRRRSWISPTSWCPRRCSPSRATRSRSRASIPTPASSTTGWKARPASRRRKCAAICCSTTRDKANCGGCHLDKPSPDGIPPVFTDGQFEALGAPRNPALRRTMIRHISTWASAGRIATDMRDDTQFCGMFITPTLRNVATRQVFFHNGVFHQLQQVMDFYAFRDVAPAKVYPGGGNMTTSRRAIAPISTWWTRHSTASLATRRR